MRAGWRGVVFMAMIVFLVEVGASQETPLMDLSIPKDGKRLSQWATATFGNIECDGGGGIYLQLANPDLAQAAVIRVSTDGTARYDLSKATDLSGGSAVMAFTVDVAGNVKMLVSSDTTDSASGKSESALYLVSFSKAGDLNEIHRLPQKFIPSRMAALPDGDLLITGTEPAPKGQAPKAVIGVFDNRGNQKRAFMKSWDERFSVSDPNNPGLRNPLIQFGRVRVATDGTIYIYKPSTGPFVDIYNPGGKLLHHFALRPPLEKLQPFDMFYSDGKIVISYQWAYPVENGKIKLPKQPDTRLFHSIYSASDGELLRTYLQDAPGILACVEHGEATMLDTTIDKHFEIKKFDLQ